MRRPRHSGRLGVDSIVRTIEGGSTAFREQSHRFEFHRRAIDLGPPVCGSHCCGCEVFPAAFRIGTASCPHRESEEMEFHMMYQVCTRVLVQ